MRLLSKPYLDRYQAPIFSQYDCRKGSTIEHMSKFVDILGPYVVDEDLCLRVFSKSLCDHANTWYTWLKARIHPYMG